MKMSVENTIAGLEEIFNPDYLRHDPMQPGAKPSEFEYGELIATEFEFPQLYDYGSAFFALKPAAAAHLVVKFLIMILRAADDEKSFRSIVSHANPDDLFSIFLGGIAKGTWGGGIVECLSADELNMVSSAANLVLELEVSFLGRASSQLDCIESFVQLTSQNRSKT